MWRIESDEIRNVLEKSVVLWRIESDEIRNVLEKSVVFELRTRDCHCFLCA